MTTRICRASRLMLACGMVFGLASLSNAQLSQPPIGYWNFDDGTVADLSGNDIHGTLNGSGTFSNDVPSQIGSGMSLMLAPGITGDGMGDYVDLGNPSILNFGTNDYTIAGWIKTDDGGQSNFFSNGGDNGGGVRYVLALGETGGDGSVVLTTDDNTTKSQAISAGGLANDNMWHHIAGVREGTAIRVYFDGMEVGMGTVPAGYDLSGTSQKNAYIGVGRSQPDDLFIKQLGGLYDDVAVWNVALSPAEIAGLADGSIAIGGMPAVQGDFNGDGVVNNADFVVLSNNLAGHLDGPVGRAEGDLNFDGQVNLDDFGLFKELFPGALGQAQAVPEPSTFALSAVLLAAAGCLLRRFRT